MKLKNIFNKIAKPQPKNVKSDESYCYSNTIWNTDDNLIILISFTEDYFDQVIDIQDAIVNCKPGSLYSKMVYSSYDEYIARKDENGDAIKDLLIHKKHYMLIGGAPSAWQELYMNINILSNSILDGISKEIVNNCNPVYFSTLINDGILDKFNKINDSNDNITTSSGCWYTDPEILLNKLPDGFTGKDLLKFIKIHYSDNIIKTAYSALEYICRVNNEQFKSHDLYSLYKVLIKDPTIEKLSMLLEPLYKQPDDDNIPGDISDESLDAIFREHYEKFNATYDGDIHYEDIDEVLGEDEESENIRKEDILNDTY